MEIVEKHHNLKLDAPSGTALALADSMNEALDNAYEYKYDRSKELKKRDKYEIGISDQSPVRTYAAIEKFADGADVAAWGENAKSAAGVVLTKVENGMTVVVGGELDLGAASIPTATATYGVVTSAIVTATDGKAEFTIWNGAEYIDVVTKSSVSSLAKWDVVDYQKNTDGTYQIAEVGDGTRLSITGYSATSGDIKVNWGSGDNDRVVTEDTVVIFVNTDADADAAGLLGESIEVSAQPNGVDYNRNAVCVKDATTNDLLVLVIDPLNTVYGD